MYQWIKWVYYWNDCAVYDTNIHVGPDHAYLQVSFPSTGFWLALIFNIVSYNFFHVDLYILF